MTVRTTISMPDDIWSLVEGRQKETGASTSEIVRRALAAYFEGNGKPAKATRPLKAVKAPVAKATTRKPPATKRVSKRPAAKTA